MTRPSRGGRTRRDEVRSEVLQATERLLIDGERFTALGVSRICEEAGVARSAFYTNFTDKSALLIALTTEATGELFAASGTWIAHQLELGPPALAATLANSLRVLRKHAAVISAYREVSAYDPVVARLWTSKLDELVIALRDRIAARGPSGDGAMADAMTTAQFIVWGAERALIEQTINQRPETDRDYVDRLAMAVSRTLETS